jgi:chemotaxis protein MotA
MFKIFFEGLWKFDILIFIAAAGNIFLFLECRKNTDIVYKHFNRMDHTSNLTEEQKAAFQSGQRKETVLTAEELLQYREKTNRFYSFFTNITSTFPLMGMLGTVISLLRMGDLIGTEVQGAFFTALTSTFWGIIAAIAFKASDASIAYKIEDNEKHLEYLFNPNKEGKS